MGENGIPDITVLMATRDDEFRKPNAGMWTFFVEHLNGGVEPGARPVCWQAPQNPVPKTSVFLCWQHPTQAARQCFCAGSSPPRQPVSAPRQEPRSLSFQS